MHRLAAVILLACSILVTGTQSALAITISTVPIGNTGNASDPLDGDHLTPGVQNYGIVNYAYSIGTTEVTVGQYTEFLNAVAATDTYSLYDTQMTTDVNVAGIQRSGSPGSYTYSVIGSPNKPVTYASWGDAARFVNWLNNGQPSGMQNATTTEDGAYTLNGANTTATLNAVTRNGGATWVIPNENEWYKAAYHKNNGVAADYWSYPTKSNIHPYSDQPPGLGAPVVSNTGNFRKNDGIANGYDDGCAVTGNEFFSGNMLTDVGAYTFSTSAYGTFDQGGNAYEWTESSGNFGRTVRGGSWYANIPSPSASGLNARVRHSTDPMNSVFIYGFRVATLGNQATVSILNEPTTTPLGGGSTTVGGVVVNLTATSAGSFQETYTTYNLNQLPPIPAFAPGNFLLSVPGSTLQFWDLHYTGEFEGSASVTFRYDPSLITPGATIGIWHFDSVVGWEFLGGSIDGDTITVTTDSFSPFALAVAPPPPSADFNGDGTIDAADYVVWSKGLANGTYENWREQFGNFEGGSSASAPEPTTLWIACVYAAGICSARFCRFPRSTARRPTHVVLT